MKYYELTYRILPNLSAQERETLSERIISDIQAQPAKIQEGPALMTLEFYAEPEKIKDIEVKLKQEPGIQRYMILVKEPKKAKTEIRIRKRPVKPLIEKGEKSIIKTEEKKVDLKEIGQKLDEILGQ